MPVESTAHQWSLILATMHMLATMDPAPVSALVIAQHSNLMPAIVERHLRSMARVGLVRHIRRPGYQCWQLQDEQ